MSLDDESTRARWALVSELIALVGAGACLVAAWTGLQMARRHADPRFAMIDTIRREAGPRDLILLPEESLDLASRAAPVPVLWGTVSLRDLHGLRRLYALTPSHNALFAYEARLGTGRALGTSSMAWDLARTATVQLDITTEIGGRLSAKRIGGVHDGDCPLQATGLICHGEPWNHVRAETHHFDGTELMCLFAHPQADGRLELALARLPPLRALVGVAGIDDAGQHPGGAPVHMDVHFTSATGTVVDRRVSTSDARGVVPYRVELPYEAGGATLTITTPNAGARQFCFTMYGTE